MRREFGRGRGIAVALILGSACFGCAHHGSPLGGGPGVAPAAHIPWAPRAEEHPSSPAAVPPEGSRTAIAAFEPDSLGGWTLARMIDVALRNSPDTRGAWASARSAAAAYRSEQGSYLPKLTLGATGMNLQNVGGGGASLSRLRNYAGSAEVNWLLFDFGRREASLEEMRQNLIASDWNHNSAIQDVVLQVERAFYSYLGAKALLRAEESTLDQARTALAAAEARREAGVATIVEVLQARTALSQAKLAADGLNGQLQTMRGALALSMGLPASTRLDPDLPLDEPPAAEIGLEVEALLARAQKERPDLAAGRAQVARSEATLHGTESEGFPTLSFVGGTGRTLYDMSSVYANNWSASVQLRWPVFTGFSHTWDVRQAAADVEASRARLARAEQNAGLEVWTSYYDLTTAQERLSSAADLLAAAEAAHEVAFGRYQEGVGGIIDLLATQSALENARAQQVLARTDWHLALASLARATGSIGMGGSPEPEEGK